MTAVVESATQHMREAVQALSLAVDAFEIARKQGVADFAVLDRGLKSAIERCGRARAELDNGNI